ncbi:MAG TPA: nuclear transport factor 2 family protein [Chitinophagaceae bacterium]|nr:nuclear transport factor 2 family protein [Chitinophagaceae bacterium]
MKKLIITLSSLLNVVCICAQTNPSKAEIEIRNLEEKERNAMLNHDTLTLKKMWVEDFTVNAPFNRVLLSRRELMDMVNKGNIRFSSFTRNIEQVVVKKNIAVTMGSEEVVFTGNVSQAGQTIKRRFTNIWVKQNGVWELTFRHANNLCAP